MDIKRTAEKNLIFYQKQITDAMQKKQLLVVNQSVNSIERNLQKEFKYYRLSLYIYSLASFLEVMLLGNFQEEYILQVKSVIEKYSEEYKDIYTASSGYIDRMSGASIEANIVNGIGTAGKAIGNFIGGIPLIKESPVDEWLIEGGIHLKQTSQDMKKKVSARFEVISDAGTEVFIAKFEEMNQIYNYTSSICFDNEKIYLVEG